MLLHPGQGNFCGADHMLEVDDDTGLGVIDDSARRVFMTGQCHNLCDALVKLTGWTPVMCCYCDDHEEWDHAMVQMPDGRYLDINGIQDDGPDWADYMVPVEPEQVLYYDMEQTQRRGYPATPEIAAPFARALLHENGLEV